MGRALDARRAWRRSPSIRARKSHGLGARYPVPATFPQLPRNSTWWGSSHGATWCHIPRDIQCYRVAYGSNTLRERLGMARVFGRSYSTHAWKDHENHWKTITTFTILGYAWKWGPRANPWPAPEFRVLETRQTLKSLVPATFPQLPRSKTWFLACCWCAIVYSKTCGF